MMNEQVSKPVDTENIISGFCIRTTKVRGDYTIMLRSYVQRERMMDYLKELVDDEYISHIDIERISAPETMWKTELRALKWD